MANIFTSSIGKKLIMSISGLFLIIFLLLHMTINFFSVIDSFTGKYGAADGLFQAGCDFMALPIVTVMVPVLAFGFVIHIIYAAYLTWCNIQSRGGYKRYEVASKAKTESWASTNMFALGIIVLGILGFHLSHFWADMQLQEFMGSHAENPYELLNATFGTWWIHRMVRSARLPPYTRFLERIPDSGTQQRHLGEETPGTRLHLHSRRNLRIRSGSCKCILPCKRTDFLRKESQFTINGWLKQFGHPFF